MEKISSMVKRDINHIRDLGSSQHQFRAAPDGNWEQNTLPSTTLGTGLLFTPSPPCCCHSQHPHPYLLPSPCSLKCHKAIWNMSSHFAVTPTASHRGRGLCPACKPKGYQHIPWALLMGSSERAGGAHSWAHPHLGGTWDIQVSRNHHCTASLSTLPFTGVWVKLSCSRVSLVPCREEGKSW